MHATQYLRSAFRHLRRRPGYVVLNLVGLTVGLALALLAFRQVHFELSFDDFHEKGDRVYRLLSDVKLFAERRVSPATQGPTGPALVKAIPEIQAATRVQPTGSETIWHGRQAYGDVTGLFADSSFFEIFSFDLKVGDPHRVLTEPHTAVLTESLARRLFGEASPLGQTITFPVGGFDEKEAFTVRGVLEDPPPNSHLRFDVLLSFASFSEAETDLGGWKFWTYLLLEKGAQPDQLTPQLDEFASRLLGPRYSKEKLARMAPKYHLQPLTDIYLATGLRGWSQRESSWMQVMLFGTVGILLLVIAGGNYLILATARAQERRTEVGMRKAMGAGPAHLTGQLLSEGLMLVLGALPAALLLAWAALPLLRSVTGQHVPYGFLTQPGLLIGAIGLAGLLGILASVYPALLFARFDPARLLRPGSEGSDSPALVRKGLVVVQFVISIGLIAAALVVARQAAFLQEKNLGFDTSSVAIIRAPSQEALEQLTTIRDRVRRAPAVEEAAATGWVPGLAPTRSLDTVRAAGRKKLPAKTAYVDTNVTEVFGIELIAGNDLAGGPSRGVLINQKAATRLGWTPREATERQIYVEGAFQPIRGVTTNFHHAPLREQVTPLVLYTEPHMPAYTTYGRLAVRLDAQRVETGLREVRQIWEESLPGTLFNYAMLEDRIDQVYAEERRLQTLLTYFAGAAILLAGLGLAGLAAYIVRRRTGEIAIRKVLGARTEQIAALLSRQFGWLLLIGVLIATPLAWWAAQQWLRQFAYHIEPGPGLFIGAGLTAGLVALLAAGTQTLRAALRNPARSLRHE